MYNNGYIWNLKKNLDFIIANFGDTSIDVGGTIYNNNITGDIHIYSENIYPDTQELTFENNPAGLNSRIKIINDTTYIFYTQKSSNFVIWYKNISDEYFQIFNITIS